MARENREYRPGAPIVAELSSGAVVVRGATVLLLHERREDRWCLPKGHVDPGESLEAAALREVQEETGLEDVRLGPEVGEVSYRFFSPSRGLNVHKTGVYFLASSAAGSVRTEAIFDRFEWAPFDRAPAQVRYETDRTIVRKALELHSKPAPRSS
jgi:8-oxo-dGTP pyrophosphatase MutT (NUDIX family)